MKSIRLKETLENLGQLIPEQTLSSGLFLPACLSFPVNSLTRKSDQVKNSSNSLFEYQRVNMLSSVNLVIKETDILFTGIRNYNTCIK